MKSQNGTWERRKLVKFLIVIGNVTVMDSFNYMEKGGNIYLNVGSECYVLMSCFI